jgi:undecaprenyl-diphosphatase
MVGVAHDRWPPTAGSSAPPLLGAHEADHPLRRHARRAAVVLGCAYALLTVTFLIVGFTLTKLLGHSVGSWDEHVNAAVVHDRTATWNSITATSTSLMNTLPVVAMVIVLVAVFAWRRWWEEALLVAFAMAMEITVFLSTTFVVARPRPAVPRMNMTPATGSFPSGHTAAATVLCVALAYIVTRRIHHAVVGAVVWALAAMAVAAVGYGRVYRGLHHPSDVFAGVALGVAAIVAARLAVRAALADSESIRTPH